MSTVSLEVSANSIEEGQCSTILDGENRPFDLESIYDISRYLKAAQRLDNGAEAYSRRESHYKGNCHSPLNGEQPIFALLGYSDIQSLEGRVLTIIDAAFVDREQRKAVKDLIRNAIWFDWVKNLDTDTPYVGKPDRR